MPALFSIMFLGMQAALYYHARSVAIASAAEGARTVGGQDQNLRAGLQAASSFLADAGGNDVLKGASVSGSRSATKATVTVKGTSLSVVPGWSISVTQSATVPIERITQPSGEFTNFEGSGGGN